MLLLTMTMLIIAVTPGWASNFTENPHVNSPSGYATLYAEASDTATPSGEYYNGVMFSLEKVDGGWTSVSVNGRSEGSSICGFFHSEDLSYDDIFEMNIAVAEVISDDAASIPLLDRPNGQPIGDCLPGMRVMILADVGNEWRHVKFGSEIGYLPTANLANTGNYVADPYNELPVIGYGAYLYEKSDHGNKPFH